jgi:hypothetical protein
MTAVGGVHLCLTTGLPSTRGSSPEQRVKHRGPLIPALRQLMVGQQDLVKGKSDGPLVEIHSGENNLVAPLP